MSLRFLVSLKTLNSNPLRAKTNIPIEQVGKGASDPTRTKPKQTRSAPPQVRGAEIPTGLISCTTIMNTGALGICGGALRAWLVLFCVSALAPFPTCSILRVQKNLLTHLVTISDAPAPVPLRIPARLRIRLVEQLMLPATTHQPQHEQLT